MQGARRAARDRRCGAVGLLLAWLAVGAAGCALTLDPSRYADNTRPDVGGVEGAVGTDAMDAAAAEGGVSEAGGVDGAVSEAGLDVPRADAVFDGITPEGGAMDGGAAESGMAEAGPAEGGMDDGASGRDVAMDTGDAGLDAMRDAAFDVLDGGDAGLDAMRDAFTDITLRDVVVSSDAFDVNLRDFVTVDSGTLCSAGTTCPTGFQCCFVLGTCTPNTCADCCPGVTDAGVPDAGTTDVGATDALGCNGDPSACGAGQSCCASTGHCYSTTCLACCMPTVELDVFETDAVVFADGARFDGTVNEVGVRVDAAMDAGLCASGPLCGAGQVCCPSTGACVTVGCASCCPP